MSLSPNTWITVTRGSGEDEYGDETDATTAVYTRIPATLTAATKSTFRQGKWISVEVWSLSVTARYTLKVSDIVTDKAGRRYVVNSLTDSNRWVLSGQSAECTRITT